MNAATIAASRGLRVEETLKPKASKGGAGSVLSIQIDTQTEEHIVKGAVLRENTPRLLHVDGIDVEAPLERKSDLYAQSGRARSDRQSRHGVRAHNINIANFSLGRRTAGGQAKTPAEAIAVVHVDSPVPATVLLELKKIPAVHEAKAIQLY